MRDYEHLDHDPLTCEPYEHLEAGTDVPSATASRRKDSPREGGVQPAVTPAGGGAHPTVSVLVVARNQAEFLASCLHSTLAQTVRPDEVLYLDDGSEDDSLDVAGRFTTCGVQVRGISHRGALAARNVAAESARGDFLLFVDGDNLLAPDFLERQLEAIGKGAAFAYPSKQNFGRVRKPWQPPEYDRDRLWLDNFIDTSALVRHELFTAAGRWQTTPADTYWDWDLWLRVGRLGEGVRSDAVLHYRLHERNWSRVHRQSVDPRIDLKGEVRRAAARVAVCCVYSGRLPGLLPQWLDALAASTSRLGRERPELFILDDSPAGFWTMAGPHVSQLASIFGTVRVVRIHDGIVAAERRRDRTATARFLSALYNRFLDETAAEVLWFVEDDILVPEHAGERLLRFLLDGDRPKAAVSSFYRSRFEDCYVVSRVQGRAVVHERERPPEPQPYDLAGTGCLMIFRPLAKARFAPCWKVPESGLIVHAHDWVYSWQLREQGQPVIAHPEVVCRHYRTEVEWV